MPVGVFNMAAIRSLPSSVTGSRNKGAEGCHIFKFNSSEHVIAAKSCI